MTLVLHINRFQRLHNIVHGVLLLWVDYLTVARVSINTTIFQQRLAFLSCRVVSGLSTSSFELIIIVSYLSKLT